MSDITTIARPYAKAVFELAVETKQLAAWSDILLAMAQVASLPEAIQFINNPVTTITEQEQLFLAVVVRLKSNVDAKLIERFVALLADNSRLLLIPGIYVQYERLRADQEKTLTATVSSFTPLSDRQQQQLIEKLTQRFKRQVTLEISIDESLLGGALIQAGDLVIDGSVRGQLLKLASSLAV
jgi:F-type H+-transporting ATPase subunit delta